MSTTVERLADYTQVQLTRAKALDAARWCRALYDADGGPLVAAQLFEQRYPRSIHLADVRDFVTKAATGPGTTTDSTWAAPLSAPRQFTEALITLARPATIIGRLQGLRSVPFNVTVPAVTAGATFSWAGQGKPKPVGSLSFDPVTLAYAKASGILVVSTELIRSSTLSGERALRDELVAGLVSFLDEQFLDPTVAPVTDISPGSILNGITPFPSTGDPRQDITYLVATFTAASPATSSLAFVLSPTNAAILGSTGAFPDLRIDGTGFIAGVPALTSTAMADRIALVDPTRILVGDDGGLEIDVSRNASVHMNTVPADPADASTVMTSLWQHDLVGIRVERFINWKRGVDSAVAYVSDVAYQGGSPA